MFKRFIYFICTDTRKKETITAMNRNKIVKFSSFFVSHIDHNLSMCHLHFSFDKHRYAFLLSFFSLTHTFNVWWNCQRPVFLFLSHDTIDARWNKSLRLQKKSNEAKCLWMSTIGYLISVAVLWHHHFNLITISNQIIKLRRGFTWFLLRCCRIITSVNRIFVGMCVVERMASNQFFSFIYFFRLIFDNYHESVFWMSFDRPNFFLKTDNFNILI